MDEWKLLHLVAWHKNDKVANILIGSGGKMEAGDLHGNVISFV